MKYKLIAVAVLILMALIFIIQNSMVVDINVFFWTIKISRILLMLILLIVGIIIGFLLNSYIKHPESP